MSPAKPAHAAAQYSDVVAFLDSRSVGQVTHVAKSLFEHLHGTYQLLKEWGSPDDLCYAGLCHAVYGTDGFSVSLLDVRTERRSLAAVIGPDAEALVYLYASCDRSHLYPQIGAADRLSFRDRFTAETFVPDPAAFAAFMELTFANELDMFRDDPALVEGHQATWGVRFERSRRFVSDAAFDCFRSVFGGADRRPA